jgi:hypothetical protein
MVGGRLPKHRYEFGEVERGVQHYEYVRALERVAETAESVSQRFPQDLYGSLWVEQREAMLDMREALADLGALRS